MSSDMTIDIMVNVPAGKKVLEKMQPVCENFRLYQMELLTPDNCVMKITGVEFRVAKPGPYKGKLSILIKGTDKIVHITATEKIDN